CGCSVRLSVARRLRSRLRSFCLSSRSAPWAVWPPWATDSLVLSGSKGSVGRPEHEKAVDVIQIDWRQPSHRLFELELSDDGHVIGPVQVALGAVQQLLGIENVNLRAHPD